MLPYLFVSLHSKNSQQSCLPSVSANYSSPMISQVHSSQDLLQLLHLNYFQETSSIKSISGFHADPFDTIDQAFLLDPLSSLAWQSTTLYLVPSHNTDHFFSQGFLYSSMNSKYWITPELCSWIFSTFIYCFVKFLHFPVIKYQIHTSHRPIFLTPESHIQFLAIVTTRMSNRYLKLNMPKTKFLLHPPHNLSW